MKIKELIRQLQEYEKIYNPDMEVMTRIRLDDPEGFFEVIHGTITGIDYVGDSQIMILFDEE